MKFGQHFHRYQVPEWEPFYVDYDQLKKLFSNVKQAIQSGTEPSLTELHSCLSCNIDALIAFQNSKLDILHRKQAEICKRYGLSLHPYVVPVLEEANHHELTDLLEACTELQKDLKKLQWYNRVNREAIDRVYGKLRKCSSFVDRPYENHQAKWLDLQLASESQCLKDAERLDELVADIERACSNAQSAADGTSLYLKNVCDQQSPSLVYPTAAYRAIRGDQPFILAKALERKTPRNSAPRSQLQPSLGALFELSISCQSRRCAGFLLSEELPNTDVVFDHNCINHLITTTGRSNTTTDRDDPGSTARETIDQSTGEITTDLFLQILDQLGPKQKVVLEARDALGRLPLHYAALYGLTAICQSILKSLQEFGQSSSAALDAILSVDAEGFTPIQLAVGRGHTVVAELFLGVLEPSCQVVDGSRGQHLRSVLAGLLFVVLRSQYDVLVQLFASSHIDINHQSTRGQTALYIAAQIGREDYLKMLLESTPGQNASVDIAETAYGWTPLFIACIEGHLAVVELLLQAGASQQIVDCKGWTAKEHAAFRGHLAVAEKLEVCRTEDPTNGPASVSFMTAKNATQQLRPEYSHVIVNLGVVQKGKQVEAVALEFYSSKEALGPHTDTRFSIEVSAPGETGSSQLVQLPILNDTINEPYVFPIKSFRKAQLTLNIFCASAAGGRKGILVGSGTALLESQQHCYGTDRESLIREHTVPILKRATLDLMGTITFTCVIAKPCMKLNSPSTTQRCLKEADSVQLVGHRGLGQNIASHEHLQLGENTVQSFLSAARLGASFVEFDVQLTRDLMPVIYHDFSLSESGTDVPIHDLSLKQFMYAGKIQSPRGDPVSVLGRPKLKGERSPTQRGKPRSRSLTREQECGAKEVQDRMKYTVDFMNKGFKPNTRGGFIHDSFATLKELLLELPKSIKFDIEIKYPRLHEAVDAGVAPVAIELNTFIDTSLETIYRFAGDRTIILSSFTPEVCILLSIKQQTYPVVFITNAGKPPMTDLEMRASSLQVAVRFAKLWNLSGVVFASETLIMCPRLIKYVKRAGLSCSSYGLLNNIPDNAKLQAEAGLDILMADRIGLISKTLKDASSNGVAF